MNKASGDHSNRLRTPLFSVQRRLFSDILAIVSMCIIAVAIIVAIAGYLVLPDNTTNANDGAVEIGKLTPGSSVTIIKLRKNIPIEERSILEMIMAGKERKYIIVPVDDYAIENLTVKADLFGVENSTKSIDLVDAVLPLGQSQEKKYGEYYKNTNYYFDGETVRYPNMLGDWQAINYTELVDRFRQDHTEKRVFWLGTDRSGRDLLSRLMLGTRVSLSIGFLAVCISLILGITFGTLSGYFGGKIDDVIMWIISVVWAIPGVMLVIAVSMALQSRGLWVAFLAVGLTMWVEVARVVRGQMMSLKEKLFVEAARAYGLNSFSIVFKHIMPNMAGPLLVIATANFAAAIMLEAGLSFLGLGVQPPAPSWGMMVYEGFQVMGSRDSWHMILFPGLAICLLVLCFNILGNSLHDALSPRSSEKK